MLHCKNHVDEETLEYFERSGKRDEITFRTEMMIQKRLSKEGKKSKDGKNIPSIREIRIKKNKEGIAIVEVSENE
jgi:hypothetical protein